jgi:serine/threonine protein kinase
VAGDGAILAFFGGTGHRAGFAAALQSTRRSDLFVMSDGSGNDGSVHAEWSADELIPFGKYVLLDRLSSGATAAVYRANVRGEAGFERLVAIKRILPHMAGDRDFVDTFVREAKTVARLTHAAICPIYELGKVDESLYTVTPSRR